VITLSEKSKFYGIRYPIFCLKFPPAGLKIHPEGIAIQKREFSDWNTLDQYDPQKPFLSRYLVQDTGTFEFDYTCQSITQLISNRIQWGIDSNAKIYNFQKKQKFRARNSRVRRVVNNIIWLDRISYPFEISKSVVVPRDLKRQWATMVLIDGTWELYKFYSFPEPIESILL
jgi:hypothetical protein